MRLLALTLALASLPAFAQTQIAPGVQLSRPGEGMPGMVSPGLAGANVPAVADTLDYSMPGSMPASPAPEAPQSREGAQTATEQGWVDNSGAELALRMMEDARARSTPRQRGIVVNVPTLATPVSADASSREWLHNWEFTLNALGVSRHKVRFEASRLSRSDFEAWASRQFRFRQAHHTRLQVLERPGASGATGE